VKYFLRSDFIMRIGHLLIMIVAIATIIIIPVLAGALVGAIVALLLQTDLIPAALIGALGGGFTGYAFLLLSVGMHRGGQ
jgi:hypothetical protein